MPKRVGPERSPGQAFRRQILSWLIGDGREPIYSRMMWVAATSMPSQSSGCGRADSSLAAAPSEVCNPYQARTQNRGGLAWSAKPTRWQRMNPSSAGTSIRTYARRRRNR